MSDNGAVSIYNEEGKLKTKEEFTKEMEEIYDECIQHVNEHEHDCECGEMTIFDILTNPETQTDTENAFLNHDYYERAIYIDGEITSEKATQIYKKIRFYNKMDLVDGILPEERNPIKILINSDGGDLYASFSIVSSIKISKTPVYTYNIGTACSGAFLILIAGHKRFGLPYTTYLYHEGSCGTFGDAHKFISFSNYYAGSLEQIKKLILSNTEITEEDYDNHHKDDWWFTADEAFLYDIIDDIVEDFEGKEVTD